MKTMITVLFCLAFSTGSYAATTYSCHNYKEPHSIFSFSFFDDENAHLRIRDGRWDGPVKTLLSHLMEPEISRGDILIPVNVASCRHTDLNGLGSMMQCDGNSLRGTKPLIMKCGEKQRERPNSTYMDCNQIDQEHQPSSFRLDHDAAKFSLTVIKPYEKAAHEKRLPFSITLSFSDEFGTHTASWNYRYWENKLLCFNADGFRY
jgi:hypothetical protein